MSGATSACDVLVAGAGPAGLAAAARAAEVGARVVVVDEGLGPGGQIWRPGTGSRPSRPAQELTRRFAASGAELLSSTSIVDAWVAANGTITVATEGGEGSMRIDARMLIIATGARERFLPFPGWTLQNVFGIGGAQALLKSGMSVRGKRVVIGGTGPLLLPVAAALSRAGARLRLVAEQASLANVARFAVGLVRRPAMLAQATALRAAFLGTSYSTGTWISEVHGDIAARAVTVTNGRRMHMLECDIVCTAYGLAPNTELARLLGCATRDGTVVVDERQQTTVANVYCAGEPTGIGGVDLALVEGEIAGAYAAGAAAAPRRIARRGMLRRHAARLEAAFALRPAISSLATPDTLVCRCEDVRLGALNRAWTPRQAKLYTRIGMGACQGRICGAALECLMQWTADSIRPPTQPATVETLMMYARNSTSNDQEAQ